MRVALVRSGQRPGRRSGGRVLRAHAWALQRSGGFCPAV